MALANYVDLQASVASWMNRTDLTSIIPDFITIAESRIARNLRLRKQLTTTTLIASTTSRAVALPTDWLEFENLTIAGTPETPCQYVTVEHMDVKYPEGGPSSRPIVFTIEGDNVLFGPAPDSAYTINIIYFARFASLATASTNWLMTNHPSIYLYACLREGALFVNNDERAAHWEALFQKNIEVLQDVDDRSNKSGSALRVKVI